MLHTRGSRLRNGDGHTLVVTLIDIVVDSYIPVVDAVEAAIHNNRPPATPHPWPSPQCPDLEVQLDWLSEKLKREEHHFHKVYIYIYTMPDP